VSEDLHGSSSNKLEDTKKEHLELPQSFDKLADKAIRWITATAFERAANRECCFESLGE
jgi:hypothetical protein